MKRTVSLAIISLLLLSTFSILTPQVKAETTNPSSTGLYAGSTNPGAVWEYKGGSTWDPISPLIGYDMIEPLGWSVTSITLYEGKLYAAAITHPDIYSSSGRVWRYEGDQRWTLVGILEEQVTFLIVYKGDLYAGTATPARLYKFIPEITAWHMVLNYASWFGFRSAYVWGDWLYLGEWYYDRFARWDGTTFQEFQPYYWGSCIYNFEEYKGHLYAGAYVGTVYKVTYEPPTAIAIWGPAPNYRYAWSLKEFKGNLYIGFDADGTRTALLYKYDGTNPPAQVWSYSTTTTNPYEGIISMATDEAYLYIGIGGEAVGYPSYMSGVGTGYVYKYDGTNPPTPISGTLGTGVQTLFYARIQPIQAAQLAKMIIGGPYVNRKGWDSYFETPEQVKEKGLDCSGVVFWAYNRAYFGGKKLTAVDKANRPLYPVYADGQYRENIIRLTKEKLRLRQGDLLFFDAYSDSHKGMEKGYKIPGQDDHIDHVAMYVGPFLYEGKEYNVTESTGAKEIRKIIATTVDEIIERITEFAGKDAFKGFGRVIDWQRRTEIIGKSSGFSIDLIVIDPEGLVVSKEIPDVLGMYYMEYDIDDDGTIDDSVVISERKIGDYLITVVPEPDALPTDTYTLEVSTDGITIVLAENVQISNIPNRPYVLRSAETDIIPIIPATADFDPDILNLKSIDQWVTVYIELPVGHGYSVSMINLTSIRLNDKVPALTKPIAIGDYDNDGTPDLMVKFSRKAVQRILQVGDRVEITISGKLTDGRLFEGKDIIRVIRPP